MKSHNQPIYLDFAAATPVDPKVLKAMEPYFSEKFFSPTAIYLSAKKVASDIKDAKQEIGHWLGAKPGEMIFTAGGTEANNLAIRGIMERFPDKKVLVCAIEHDSVRQPAKLFKGSEIPVDNKGIIDLEKLRQLIDDQTVLVSVGYVNNEIGVIQPIRKVATLIQEIRNQRLEKGNDLPIYLHSDACQAASYMDLHTAKLGVDLMSLNSSKFYGPRQTGLLYVKAGISLTPLVLGGGQQAGVRSGTENASGIVGFTKALQEVQDKRFSRSKKVSELRDYFIKQLSTNFKHIFINGSLKHRNPDNVSVTFPGQDNERLLMELDERGIICARGSACSASSEEPSHVLKSIGLSDADARATLRFSLGKSSTKADIDQTIEVLKEIIGE